MASPIRAPTDRDLLKFSGQSMAVATIAQYFALWGMDIGMRQARLRRAFSDQLMPEDRRTGAESKVDVEMR